MTSPFIHWIEMGGYAFFVWFSYGIVGAVLIMNAWSVKRQKKKISKKLHAWFKRQ